MGHAITVGYNWSVIKHTFRLQKYMVSIKWIVSKAYLGHIYELGLTLLEA